MYQSRAIAIKCVRLYQRYRIVLDYIFVSVFGVVSGCKHTPTCSEYTIQEILKRGTIAGLISGGKRILACR